MYLIEDLNIESNTQIIDIAYDHGCDLKRLTTVINQCFIKGHVSYEDNIHFYEMLFRSFSSVTELNLYIEYYKSDKNWVKTLSYKCSIFKEAVCTFLKSAIVNHSA